MGGGGLTTLTMKILFREKEVRQLKRLLYHGKSVVLSGESGVGKDAIFWEFVRRTHAAVITMDVRSLIMESASREELTSLVEDLIDDAATRHTLLYVRHIELLKVVEDGGCASLFSTPDEQPSRLLYSLCARVGRGEVQCVATTTAYDSMLGRVSAFFSRFQMLNVSQMSSDTAKMALGANETAISTMLMQHVDRDTIACAVKLSEKYFPRQQLPAKAIELLLDVCETEPCCSVGALVRRVAEVTSLEASDLYKDVAPAMSRSASAAANGRLRLPVLHTATGFSGIVSDVPMTLASPRPLMSP